MIERRKVMQGVGSGLPENQRVMGSSNPEHDAQLAAMTEEEQRLKYEQLELIQNMSNYVLECVEAGFETYITKEQLLKYEELDFDLITEVYEQSKVWKDNEIDKEVITESSYKISMDDPLYNPINDVDRRKRIEDQLKEMDFTEMLFNGYCKQEIPIRTNFKVVFKTLTTTQSLWVESFMVELQERTVQYVRHYSSLLQLAICLESINEREITPKLENFKNLSDEKSFKAAVEKRMEFIGNLPQAITDDLIIHYTWFTLRVRKMLGEDTTTKLGN